MVYYDPKLYENRERPTWPVWRDTGKDVLVVPPVQIWKTGSFQTIEGVALKYDGGTWYLLDNWGKVLMKDFGTGVFDEKGSNWEVVRR